jgi:predicted amidophosphoribosyltransferase
MTSLAARVSRPSGRPWGSSSTERWHLLDGLHEVDPARVEGRRVLLFDDLFRSGATLNAVTAALYDQGHAAVVCALVLTRSRSQQ